MDVVESRTKVALDEAEIGALVRDAFDGASMVSAVELSDGYFNTAYRLQVDRVGPLVLKVAPPVGVPVLTYERDLMRAEVLAMRLVADHPEVPVPAIRFADPSGSRLPVDYFFMDVVEGTPWGLMRDRLGEREDAAIERQLGRITAAINQVEHLTFGYLAAGPAFESWLEAFRWMCRTLYEDARRFDVELPVAEAVLEGLLVRHHRVFEEVVRPCLVHWDLWAGNVFVSLDTDGPIVTGVIDFERAIWGDPLMEFIPGRLRSIDAYEAGYGEPLLASRERRIRRLFYNAYLGLVLIVEDGPRQYVDKSTVEWGRGLLERAVVMLQHGDVIEGLLDYA